MCATEGEDRYANANMVTAYGYAMFGEFTFTENECSGGLQIAGSSQSTDLPMGVYGVRYLSKNTNGCINPEQIFNPSGEAGG